MRVLRKNGWLLPFILGYVIWAVFYRVNPLHFDMYVMKTDFMIRNSTLIGVLKAIFFTGGCWRNARYLVNLINIYFVSNEWISDYIMPLVFVLAVYFSQKSVNDKRKAYVSAFGIGLFMCVSNGIVGSCYSYSYVLFLLPILFISSFCLVITRYIGNENMFDTWYKKLGFITLSYCCACFNEHLSCAFSVIMIWYLCKDRFVLKRKQPIILVSTIISLCQTIYMNMYLIIKQTRPLAQGGTELFEIIKRNFRVLILETWMANPIIIISFLILLTYSVRKTRIWMCLDLGLIVLYLTWFACVYSAGGIDTVNKRVYDVIVPFIPQDMWPLWAIIYIVVNLGILYQLFRLSETIATAFFAGGCSTVPIIVTPNTGWSISAIYIFMMIISSVMLFQRAEDTECFHKVSFAFSAVIVGVGLCLFLPRISRIYHVASEREHAVKQTVDAQINGEWDNERDVLYVPPFDPRDVLFEGKPDFNTYYMWNYCYAYGLDKRTIISTDFEENIN